MEGIFLNISSEILLTLSMAIYHNMWTAYGIQKKLYFITRLKRQPTECKKIIVSYTSDKGFITRIYREPKKLSSPKTQ
jgi:hypothetical protein